jgi:hypothetical protein
MPMGSAFHGINYIFSAPSDDAPPAKRELLFNHVRHVDPDADEPAEALEDGFCPFEEQICAPEGDPSYEDDEGWDGTATSPDDRLEVSASPASIADTLDLEGVEEALGFYESLYPDDPGDRALAVPVVVGTPHRNHTRSNVERSRFDVVRWKHRTVYGPDGRKITKWTPIKSHGLHGRKRDAVKPEERREALLLKGRML